MRAISTFSLEAGISTFWCRARIELRMRASMSATGSVNLIVCFSSIRPFAPRLAENLQRLATSVVGQKRPTTKTTHRSLPGRLRNPGNLALQREPAEAKPAYPELAEIRPWPSADLAAVVFTR